jgi:hypothetical protein
MAVAYIAEFEDVGSSFLGQGVAAPMCPPLREQTVAIGAVASSAAFQPKTKLIRVEVDAICSIAVGLEAVATTSTMRMAANTSEYFSVPPGRGFRISVISNT